MACRMPAMSGRTPPTPGATGAPPFATLIVFPTSTVVGRRVCSLWCPYPRSTNYKHPGKPACDREDCYVALSHVKRPVITTTVPLIVTPPHCPFSDTTRTVRSAVIARSGAVAHPPCPLNVQKVTKPRSKTEKNDSQPYETLDKVRVIRTHFPQHV